MSKPRTTVDRPNQFTTNTDSVDIHEHCLGVHVSGPAYNNRGLCIQIRHNRRKELFEAACKIEKIVADALNDAIARGELVLPPRD